MQIVDVRQKRVLMACKGRGTGAIVIKVHQMASLLIQAVDAIVEGRLILLGNYAGNDDEEQLVEICIAYIYVNLV